MAEIIKPKRRKLKLVKGKDLKAWQHPAQKGLIDFLDYLNEDEIAKFRDGCIMNFRLSRDARQPLYTKWITWYQLYRSYSSYWEDMPEWQSKNFIPMIFELIETATSREMSAMNDTIPFWTCIASDPEMVEEALMTEQRLQNCAEYNDWYLQHYHVIKSKNMYGTGWLKHGYEFEREYEGPSSICADILDVYPDMLHESVKNMRYIFHRQIRHKDEIERMRDAGELKNVDKALSEKDGTNIQWSNIDRMRAIGIGGPSAANYMEKMEDYHEVIEYWGRFRKEESGEVFDVVHTIIDRRHSCRFEETPFYIKDDKEGFYYAIKPFTKFVNVPMAGEVYGIGLIEVVENMQYEINDTHNLMTDSKYLSLSPVFELDVDRIDTDRMEVNNFTFEPGKVIPVNSSMGPGNAMRPVQTPMQWTQGYTDVEYLSEKMRASLGLPKALAGQEGNIRETATQFSLRLKEAYERQKNLFRHTEKSMAEVGRIWYLLDRQYTDKEILISIFGEGTVVGWLNINPSKLRFSGDFKIACANLYGLKELQAQKGIEFLGVISKLPNFQSIINITVLIKWIADNMGIVDKRLFPDPKEMAAQSQAIQSQISAQNMMQDVAQAQEGGQGQGMEDWTKMISNEAQKNAPKIVQGVI